MANYVSAMERDKDNKVKTSYYNVAIATTANIEYQISSAASKVKCCYYVMSKAK